MTDDNTTNNLAKPSLSYNSDISIKGVADWCLTTLD